jgi:hypothetical protein
LRRITISLAIVALLSNAYTSNLETQLNKEENKTSYLHNISVYGVGEKVSDVSYKGLGIKYDSDYSRIVAEKGDDFTKASIVQRIDIDNRFYTKLGLGYLEREKEIYGAKRDVRQISYLAALGYGDDRNYNLEFGYAGYKLSNAEAANTTVKLFYTEGAYKYNLADYGKVDATLSFQTAEAYGKRVNDYSGSLNYYPIDDLKFGVKYDSVDHDDDDYRVTAGLNIKTDWGEIWKYSPTISYSKNLSENVASVIEYKVGIANQSLKMRDKAEEVIETTTIMAEAINPEEFKKKTTAIPVANTTTITVAENSTKTGTLSATDSNGLDLTFAKVSDPSNGTLTINSNGSYTYTPNTDFDGNDSFKYSVTNGVHTVTVTDTTPADTTAPVLDSTSQTFTTTVGTPLTLQTVTATDAVDGNVAVVQSGDTVNFNAVGTYNVVYTATDSASNSSTITHTYVVNAVPDTTAPVLDSTSQTFTTTVGTPLILQTVTATDAVDGSVTVVQSGDTVDFNTAGTYNVVYTATDSSSNSASITHTYTVTNTAPTASNATADAGFGETATLDLASSISDAETTNKSLLTINVTSAPSQGSLSWSGSQFSSFPTSPLGMHTNTKTFIQSINI